MQEKQAATKRDAAADRAELAKQGTPRICMEGFDLTEAAEHWIDRAEAAEAEVERLRVLAEVSSGAIAATATDPSMPPELQEKLKRIAADILCVFEPIDDEEPPCER